MPTESSARRYAEAVFRIALEQNEMERWRSDLKRIAEVMGQPQFIEVLASPRIPFSEKQKLLETRLPGVGPLATNLAGLLVAKGRMKMAGQLADQYKRLADAHLGVERAQVISAIPLEAEEEKGIARSLGQIMQKRIAVETRVDANILGGLMVRVGDRLIDGSTYSNLQALRKSLIGAGH